MYPLKSNDRLVEKLIHNFVEQIKKQKKAFNETKGIFEVC